jgi:hypothetical protein
MQMMTNLFLAGTFAISMGVANLVTAAPEDPALEPCMNGEVSASGLYPTQTQEDAALARERNLAEEERKGKVAKR